MMSKAAMLLVSRSGLMMSASSSAQRWSGPASALGQALRWLVPVLT